jgi:hypothetical protein
VRFIVRLEAAVNFGCRHSKRTSDENNQHPKAAARVTRDDTERLQDDVRRAPERERRIYQLPTVRLQYCTDSNSYKYCTYIAYSYCQLPTFTVNNKGW